MNLHCLRRRAAVFTLAVAACAAQSKSLVADIQPPPTWRPPTITVPGQAQPIELRAVSIDTQVLGRDATTRIELRLHNPNPRQLEGELQFPLLEGQAVTGFALDINGQLRDAVPVPKARGQEIFEDIRRRRVDPGLLELTATNQYKLRVYPLPPRGERRVQLTLQETLPLQGGKPQLRIPLVFSSAVGQLQLQVRAAGVAPSAARLVRSPAGVQLLGEGPDTTVQLRRSDWTASDAAGWLQLSLPDAREQRSSMIGESAGKLFFTAQLPLRDEPVRRPDPRHIALVWDASGSGASHSSRVLPILDGYFRSLRQPVRVSLLVVRNTVEAERRFTVHGGDWSALQAALQGEPFDGSSNFDSLPIPAGVDTTLLVSDGLATDGRRLIGYTAAAPVFAINGSARADLPRLARLAERTGGALIDATALTPAEAARAMRTAGWRLERLSSPAARDLVAPTRRIREQRIELAGELTQLPARVELGLVHPDGRRRTVQITLSGPVVASRWPAQRWAAWRTAELMDNPLQHQAQLRELAATHGLVGPNSSLIVLEEARDYATYELPAPPELAAEVAQLRQSRRLEAGQQQQVHLERLVLEFEQRERWWQTGFPTDTRPMPAARRPGALGEQAARRGKQEPRAEALALRAAPATVPSPAAPVAAPAKAADGSVAERSELNQLHKRDAAAHAPAGAGIALLPWTPDAPYLRRLSQVTVDQMYPVYLDERRQQAASSAFFMDAAELFFKRGEPGLALRILSNLAEMNLENRQLLRLYGYRLVQAQQHALAVPVFERVAELAPNEPQSWRDLGLALADSGSAQRGVDALWQVVARPWHGRFAGVNMIALAELNAIAAQAAARGEPLDLSRIDPRLRRNLPLALRVVMAWDTDDTDVDLGVTDPNGEKADYANRLTRQGGAVSPDATGGYGPEEFALREAQPGTYLVQAQFFGHRQQVVSNGTTVMVRVTTQFGRPEAKDEWLTLRLTRGSETARIGHVTLAPAASPQ